MVIKANRSLSPRDSADLDRSAWNAETKLRSGFYTENDPAEISRILRWKNPAVTLGPCMVLPFLGRDGKQSGFARVKPSCPRIANGKPVKYEQPLNVSPRVLFTPSAAASVSDTSTNLFITEGEKKAWAIFQAGFPCLGLCGIWSWNKPQSSPRELVDDLAAIEWRGRRVGIVFDTDERRNPQVNHARAELARVLTDYEAIVILIDLPIGPRKKQ